ncbi:MAG: 50S ribosomal protein L25/general stress protein Ctc [Pseudomonadota bacterium]|nr:50S ribosomal protein L25/general stress protein Ctc [Pseudomonadota bacterium]
MKVVATTRQLHGTGASRRLRHSGRTPGIVYGGTAKPVAIELDHNALWHALRVEAFHSSILDLEIDGKAEKVLLRDTQMHPYRQLVLHVDFQRVDAAEKIHVRVPLHFLHQDASPAVKLQGAIVSHIVTDIEVSCLPKDLPEFIEVDLSKLSVEHAVHLSDIPLPAGVTVIGHGDNPTIVVASVKGGASTDDAPGAAAEGGAEAGKPAG